jgi:hypothetical protein
MPILDLCVDQLGVEPDFETVCLSAAVIIPRGEEQGVMREDIDAAHADRRLGDAGVDEALGHFTGQTGVG